MWPTCMHQLTLQSTIQIEQLALQSAIHIEQLALQSAIHIEQIRSMPHYYHLSCPSELADLDRIRCVYSMCLCFVYVHLR